MINSYDSVESVWNLFKGERSPFNKFKGVRNPYLKISISKSSTLSWKLICIRLKKSSKELKNGIETFDQ